MSDFLLIFGFVFFSVSSLTLLGYAIYLDIRGRKLKEIDDESDPEKIIEGAKGLLKKRMLLNKGEYSFYKLLCSRLDDKHVVFPYVRLRDVVYIDTNNRPSSIHLEMIARMHYDFLVCDSVNYCPISAIEFDGKDHFVKKPGLNWDAVKNKVSAGSGIKLIRVKAKGGYTMAEIDDIIKSAING